MTRNKKSKAATIERLKPMTEKTLSIDANSVSCPGEPPLTALEEKLLREMYFKSKTNMSFEGFKALSNDLKRSFLVLRHISQNHGKPKKISVEGKRIGWLDSVRMPAHIHRTTDEGQTTVCGHPCGENFASGRWVMDSTVPRKIRGQSQYCRICFKNGGKTLPWKT